MSKNLLPAFFFLALVFIACSKKTPPEDPSVWGKIKINFSRLDEKGLTGQPDGKVSANYEFCIPAEEKYWAEVKKRDGTAELYKGSKGRAGCGSGTWLVIGSTHQKNYRRVLYRLASLPYVQEIQETFYE